MRRRVFWAMVTVAVVTLVIGGITATILVGNSVAEDRRDEFFRQADATATLIEPISGRFEGGGGEGGSRRPLRDLAELKAVLDVSRIIGGHEYLEATLSTPGGLLPLADEDDLLKALPDEALDRGGGGQYQVDVDGVDTLALVRHVGLSQGATAIVAIGSTADLVPWRDVAVRLALGLGVGVVLAAVLAQRLASSTGRRLNTLAVAASSLAGGDLGTRAVVDGDDEVAELGVAFNDMATGLEDARTRERNFLMGVGHDLRTPLTTIRGYAEALAAGDVATADLAGIADSLQMQSDRLTRLVEDLMLLSRLEASEFTLRPEQVELAAHLKEATQAFEQQAVEAGVVLNTELGDVGSVEVDPDRVAQILNNLMENALRYTPAGGTVTVELWRDESGVSFSVADTGPGISQDDLPRVFDRLYVAERYRPLRPEGSGLGLSVVRVLVTAMDGDVTVASSEAGTAFTVALGD